MAEVLTSERGEDWQSLDTELDDLRVTTRAEHFSLFALVADNSPQLVWPTGETTSFDAGAMDVTTSSPVSVSGGVITSGHVALLVAADDAASKTVTFDLAGLLPHREVYAFVGSYQNPIRGVTSESGELALDLEIRSEPTLVLFRSERSTLVIESFGIIGDGGDCSKVGDWNEKADICTLTQDVDDAIELRGSNEILLDCDGHRVSQSGLGPAISVPQLAQEPGSDPVEVGGMTIRNCTVRTNTGFAVFSGARDVSIESVDARSPDSAALSALHPDGLKVVDSTVIGELGMLATVFEKVDTTATIRNSVISGAQGLQVGFGAANDVVVEQNRFVITDARSDAPASEMYGVEAVGSLRTLGLRSNRFRGAKAVHPFVGITRNSVVTSEVARLEVANNRLEGFEHGIILRDMPSVDLAYNSIMDNGVGLRIDEVPADLAVYLNDIHDNERTGVTSASTVEVSDPRAGSATFQRGNYWGHRCDENDFFVEGEDADSGIVDSHPFGMPVASLFGLADDAIPEAPGCDQLDLSHACLDLQANPDETGGPCDTDGDGLLDHEEVFGADVVGLPDENGVRPELGHVDYPSLGANPLVPDVFIEVDWVDRDGLFLPELRTGQFLLPARPTVQEIRPVVEAFGRGGVNLHVDLGSAAPGTEFDFGDSTSSTSRIPPTDLITKFDRRRDAFDPPRDPQDSTFSFLRIGPSCDALSCQLGDRRCTACERDPRTAQSEYMHPARAHGFKYAVYTPFAPMRSQGVRLEGAVAPGATTIELTADSFSVCRVGAGVGEIEGDDGWERFTYTFCRPHEDGFGAVLEGVVGLDNRDTPELGLAREYESGDRVYIAADTKREGQAFSDGVARNEYDAINPTDCLPDESACSSHAECCSSECFGPVGEPTTCVHRRSKTSNYFVMTTFSEISASPLHERLRRRGAVFMHELGHTLGLRHAGFADVPEYKPNYLSVMCYRYLNTDGIKLSGMKEPILDYSDGSRPPLNAHATVESDVLDSQPYEIGYDCDPTPNRNKRDQATGIANQPIDWTCDNRVACDATNPCVFDNVRFATGLDTTVLRDFDDWANIDFRGGVSGLAAISNPPPSPIPTTEDPDGIEIIIDVKPGSSENPVNLKSRGVVPVALLSEDDIVLAHWLQERSVHFGATGYEARARHCAVEEVNGDGIEDVVCHFSIEEAGLEPDVQRVLVRAYAGAPLVGRDVVRVVPERP